MNRLLLDETAERHLVEFIKYLARRGDTSCTIRFLTSGDVSVRYNKTRSERQIISRAKYSLRKVS